MVTESEDVGQEKHNSSWGSRLCKGLEEASVGSEVVGLDGEHLCLLAPGLQS